MSDQSPRPSGHKYTRSEPTRFSDLDDLENIDPDIRSGKEKRQDPRMFEIEARYQRRILTSSPITRERVTKKVTQAIEGDAEVQLKLKEGWGNAAGLQSRSEMEVLKSKVEALQSKVEGHDEAIREDKEERNTLKQEAELMKEKLRDHDQKHLANQPYLDKTFDIVERTLIHWKRDVRRETYTPRDWRVLGRGHDSAHALHIQTTIGALHQRHVEVDNARDFWEIFGCHIEVADKLLEAKLDGWVKVVDLRAKIALMALQPDRPRDNRADRAFLRRVDGFTNDVYLEPNAQAALLQGKKLHVEQLFLTGWGNQLNP